MGFYSKMASTADRMLSKYGREITVTRYAVTVDESAGKPTREVESESNAVAVILPASKGTIEAFDNRLAELTLAKKNLRYVIVAAASIDFEPAPLDEVAFDGITWRVLGNTPVSPAGTPVVYRIGVVAI